MKLGLIDVGGGMRGTYAIGILEYCLENNINFDCCIGVSAGSTNLINFLAGQKERNFRNYFDYAFRKEYSGISTFFKTQKTDCNPSGKQSVLLLHFILQTRCKWLRWSCGSPFLQQPQ